MVITNAIAPAVAAGEIFTVSGTLTPAEIESIYGYLRSKWNISQELVVHSASHWHQSQQLGVPAPYTDDFNRADGDPGPNWQKNVSSWTISNNRLVKLTGTDRINWVPAMASSDHYVKAKVYNGSDEFVYMRARSSGPISAPTEYYAGNFAGVHWRIVRNISGAELFQSYAWPMPQDGDTIRIDVKGDKVTLWLNTTWIGIWTNSDITTGTSVGILSSMGVEFEDFEAGYLVPDITLTESLAPVNLVVANGQHVHTAQHVTGTIQVPTLKVRSSYHTILPPAGTHH